MLEDQKIMVVALQRVGRKDKGVLPMFDGKLEPEACMEWLEAIENHFEVEGESGKIQVEGTSPKLIELSPK